VVKIAIKNSRETTSNIFLQDFSMCPEVFGAFTGPFCFCASAWNAFEVARKLWTRRTGALVSRERKVARWLLKELLTAGNDNPDEVHENEVEPEIIAFWSVIGRVFVVMIEHGGGVIEK
jgi:hypothetical protein